MAGRLQSMQHYPKFHQVSTAPTRVGGVAAQQTVVTYDLPVNTMGVKSIAMCEVLYTFPRKGQSFAIDGKMNLHASPRYLRIFDTIVKSIKFK
jgi:hypothetical protein